MRMKKMMTVLAVVLMCSVPASAKDGYGFYGVGVAENSSEGMIQIEQQVLPQLTVERGYPVSDSVSLGFEISLLGYRNSTERWGDEFRVGGVLGGLAAWEVNDRWFFTAGGGWIFSNPLSDNASGEYCYDCDGSPVFQVCREPIQVPYVRGTVGYRLNRSLAVQLGTRNLSPYASIGYSF